MRSLTLKSSFIIALVGFSALLSVTFAFVSAYRVHADLREQLVQRGIGLIAYLDQEAVRALRLETSLQRDINLLFLTSRLVVGDVVYAQVVYEGEAISQTSRVREISPEVMSNPHRLPPIREIEAGGATYIELIRILPQYNQPSYVRMGLSTEVIDAKISETLQVMGWLSLGFLLLGSILAYTLYTMFLRPVEKVIHSIRGLAAGNLQTRVRFDRYNELSELADSFNHMAAIIERRTDDLRSLNQDLRTANEAKANFLAMVGHELKTPLHTILGYCQLLGEQLDPVLSDEQRADVEAVLSAGNHLRSLIDNMMSYAAACGKETLHLQSLHLQALIDQAVDHVRPLAHQKGLEIQVADTTFRPIQADETKLKQILINLIHNAVKYTQSGSVKVTARQDEHGVLLQVTDTGPGIPGADLERIFEPFERIERSEGNELQGLGLGLAIVKRYVTAHGGRVEVLARTAGGTAFSVYLPQQGDAAQRKEGA